MLERAVERYLVDECKARGCLCIKQGYYNGIPDRQILLPTGESIFVELKTEGGRLSAVQKAVIRRLQGMNHVVFVAWSIQDVDEILDLIDHKICRYRALLRKKLTDGWKGGGGGDCA